MNLLQSERETYEEMWSVKSYADNSPGEIFLPVFIDMAGQPGAMTATSVLDAGCGSGKGALALKAHGFSVKCCDVTDAGLTPEAKSLDFVEACLWEDLRKSVGFADWVYCCDVLEHIPTPFTMLVVSRLLEVARKGVFMSISLVPDVNGVWIGKTLHQTVQPFVAWRDQLGALGKLVEARDLMSAGAFLLKAK